MKKTQKAKETYSVSLKKILVLVGILVFVSLMIWLAVGHLMPKVENERRLSRINEIYASLNIDDQQYLFKDQLVFGDKRVYEWDKSRSYSSYKSYTRGENVDTVVADLDRKIEAAGFTELENPYPGALIIQKHYKSPKNEYVRLTVSSKPRDDAFFNAHWMKQDISVPGAMDANVGPSNVTIKVNLDDNNE